MSRGDVILRLVELTKTFETKDSRTVVALNKVTTTFKRGEFVAVVGRSGSGKSTLINILGGLDTPTGGDYYCEGNNITGLNEGHWDALRNEKIGFIFQEYHLIDYLTVFENVEVALNYQNIPEAKKKADVKNILEKIGLKDHMHKLPTQISGGQRQRVAVARALVKEPDIILADEPTGALDIDTANEVIGLIKGLSEDRLVIVVTHDRNIATNHANRIIEIGEGKFLTDLEKETIEQTYQNVYRKAEPINLPFREKLKVTIAKVRSKLFRTMFIALSLALAFSFTILFNSIERGFTQAYDEYFDSINRTNAYGFSIYANTEYGDQSNGSVLYDDYDSFVKDLTSSFSSVLNDQYNTKFLTGFSNTHVKQGDYVVPVTSSESAPDMLADAKIILLSETSSYTHSDLFYPSSLANYPRLPLESGNEIIVTEKFLREYYNLPDQPIDFSEYTGTPLEINQIIFDTSTVLDQVTIERFLGELIQFKTDLVFSNGVTSVTYTATEYMNESQFYNDIFELLDDGYELTSETVSVTSEVGTTQYVEEAADYISKKFTIPIRFNNLQVPSYCYSIDSSLSSGTLYDYYSNYCNSLFSDNTVGSNFSSYSEYKSYIDVFKDQLANYVENTSSTNLDLNTMLRSEVLYYINDQSDQDHCYLTGQDDYSDCYVYSVISLMDEFIKDQDYLQPNDYGLGKLEEIDIVLKYNDTTTDLVISGVIQNNNESAIYMPVGVYNSLFSSNDTDVTAVDGYFSVSLDRLISHLEGSESGDDLLERVAMESFLVPLDNLDDSYKQQFRLKTNEIAQYAQSGCALYTLDNALQDPNEYDLAFDNDIIADNFSIVDYSACKLNSSANTHIQNTKLMFGIFFNVLMGISIVFFTLLLNVMLEEREEEIGVYRSVGATSKDIKNLFFYVIIFILVVAAVLSITLILILDTVVNNLFVSVVADNSTIVSFAGITLSVPDGKITDISFFNLFFYIVVVLGCILFISNKNITKMSQTKPIDILRRID